VTVPVKQIRGHAFPYGALRCADGRAGGDGLAGRARCLPPAQHYPLFPVYFADVCLGLDDGGRFRSRRRATALVLPHAHRYPTHLPLLTPVCLAIPFTAFYACLRPPCSAHLRLYTCRRFWFLLGVGSGSTPCLRLHAAPPPYSWTAVPFRRCRSYWARPEGRRSLPYLPLRPFPPLCLPCLTRRCCLSASAMPLPLTGLLRFWLLSRGHHSYNTLLCGPSISIVPSPPSPAFTTYWTSSCLWLCHAVD